MATSHQIRFCLDRARETAAEYKLQTFPAGGQSLKSLDDFIGLCGATLGKDIRTAQVDIPPNNAIKAACIVYKDYYEVWASSALEINWRRLVVCKELFQVLLDEDECRNLNIWDHLQNFLSPAPEETLHASVIWERLANYAAMEFLFPYSDRVAILNACKEKGEKFDSARLEAQYGVPAVFIEIYLNDSAMEFFYSFREDGVALTGG